MPAVREKNKQLYRKIPNKYTLFERKIVKKHYRSTQKKQTNSKAIKMIRKSVNQD